MMHSIEFDRANVRDLLEMAMTMASIIMKESTISGSEKRVAEDFKRFIDMQIAVRAKCAVPRERDFWLDIGKMKKNIMA